jgi:hypothetical protein
MATLDDLHFKLGEISGQLKLLVQQNGITDSRNLAQHVELDARLRRVENLQHWYAGAASMVGAVSDYVLHLTGLLH